ncbi:MAG: hydroxymyristoyl-ACP dehydratase [Pseudomonadota bacterium]
MLGRAEIEALIPHTGAMVLIDRVIAMDERSIDCVTSSHRRDDNPLCVRGRLPAVCGAEYGAQAAAIHGPALAGARQRSGQLVLLRDISWRIPDLSVIERPLTVRAERLHSDASSIAYRFRITSEDDEIVTGECGVILS